MSDWSIALIVFVCVFASALAGIGLRSLLPDHHLSDQSKDVVRLGMGLVATMAALLLGLLISSASTSFNNQRSEIEQVASNLLLLDLTLAEYGPEANEARGSVRDLVTYSLAQLWPEMSSEFSMPTNVAGAGPGRKLYALIQRLNAQTDAQKQLQTQAAQIATELGRERWLLVSQRGDDVIPLPFLLILTFWLCALFVSFGLFAPVNSTILATLLLSALSVAGAILLILELSHPFHGFISLSSEPLQAAYAQLGK